FYTWSLEQARLLRAARWDAVDRENVAEEIESSGREQFAKLESGLRVLLTHMLQWDHQPERRTRSWAMSIKAERMAVGRVLDVNPGLKPRLTEATRFGYQSARIEAALETGLEEQTFPEQCPYSWQDITAREFSL
ncbi:MAG TPA: DUF29 domain-containing protein, partial [Xanthobacteraceae bacterium]